MPVSDEHRELISETLAMARAERKAIVVEAVREEFDRRRRMSEEEHVEHHEFVRMLISREMERQRCRERRRHFVDKLAEQVAGWGVLAILAGIGAAVWHFVKFQIRGG